MIVKSIVLFLFLVALLALAAGWLSLAIHGKTLRFRLRMLPRSFVAGYRPNLAGWRVAQFDSFRFVRNRTSPGRNFMLFTRLASFEFTVTVEPRAVLNVENDEGIGVA